MTPRLNAHGLIACSALFAAACGDVNATVTRYYHHTDAGNGPDGSSAALADQIVGYEGQKRFITGFRTPGIDLTDAVLMPEDPSGPLMLKSYKCNASRCAVEIEILDQVPNSGNAIPVPADAENSFVAIMPKRGTRQLGLVSVWPLDDIDIAADDVTSSRGTRIVSSATVATSALIKGLPTSDEPVRWFIVGGGRVGGTFDVSAVLDAARSSGDDGAAAGANAEHGGHGSSAVGSGGGNATAGATAVVTSGTAPAAGAAMSDDSLLCAAVGDVDFCGGGGGGGGAGIGGGGGGALAIVSLEPLDMTGLILRANGAAGETGGGGGAGGNVSLIAPRWSVGAPMIEVNGGAGAANSDQQGGAGSPGRVWVDSTENSSGRSNWPQNWGPCVDTTQIPAITQDSSVVIRGLASPGAAVVITRKDDNEDFMATADSTTGVFEITVQLTPGVNRLRYKSTNSDNTQVPGFCGTAFEFDTRRVPSGAFIDIGYVPASE